MITTRESINYQFSLIYGYSSPNHENLMVGDIISPGNLTKNLINELSKDVIRYLTEFNAMLRDYTGSELYSVEFELLNYKEGDYSIKIYPKSMLLMPGNYKECESLMLALKPETGYLNVHKSSQSINGISKLFFEVEDYANHPNLDYNEKKQVYKTFATRFSKKLFGELIEDKWNKKLIGLSESLPTDKKNLKIYSKLKSNLEINWYKTPFEIKLSQIEFGKIRDPFEGKSAIEHLKFSITEPSAGFVIEKTLKLGSNLLDLANWGTIDEFQERIIKFILKKTRDTILLDLDNKSEIQIISLFDNFLKQIKQKLEEFTIYCKKFLKTGEKGDLAEILLKLKKFLKEQNQNYRQEEIQDIYIILRDFIKKTISKKQEIRANDFNSSFNYFSELINRSFNKIQESLPKYLLIRRLNKTVQTLIKKLKSEFDKEQKPVKILGYRFIEKFRDHLLKMINKYSILTEKKIVFERDIIKKNFIRLISNYLDDFFDNVQLGIAEIISFAEINTDEHSKNISHYIEDFKKFSDEIHFLLSYILRYSTINRFIKDKPDKDISDPVSFSTKFHRFLEKRLAGIDLIWKSVILDWIKNYAKLFFKLEVNRMWTINEIYTDFINYLEEKEKISRNPNSFTEFLDTFIAKVENEDEKKTLMKFYEQYKYFIGVNTEFPKYLREKIETQIKSLNLDWENDFPIEILSSNENSNSFYEYIRENELKYFSNLIPVPSTMILKHKLNNEELELFKGDLFQVFGFKNWGVGNIALDLSDNFQEVYREWIKEL
ncbi:MAG: hypothetical protein R6W84_07475 [Promethearchaeia archaeon]